jgi:hypothetical protein
MYVIKKQIDGVRYSLHEFSVNCEGEVSVSWVQLDSFRIIFTEKHIAQAVLELIDDDEAVIFKTN